MYSSLTSEKAGTPEGVSAFLLSALQKTQEHHDSLPVRLNFGRSVVYARSPD